MLIFHYKDNLLIFHLGKLSVMLLFQCRTTIRSKLYCRFNWIDHLTEFNILHCIKWSEEPLVVFQQRPHSEVYRSTSRIFYSSGAASTVKSVLHILYTISLSTALQFMHDPQPMGWYWHNTTVRENKSAVPKDCLLSFLTLYVCRCMWTAFASPNTAKLERSYFRRDLCNSMPQLWQD